MLEKTGVRNRSGGPRPIGWTRCEQSALTQDLPRPPSGRWKTCCWLLILGLLSIAVCLPFVRNVFLGDEGALLHGADRMLRGERIYADFFEFYPPGGFLIVESWFRVVGTSFLAGRWLAILNVVGIVCFAFLACQITSKNAPLSTVVVAAWLVMSQGSWTQVSHHSFTTFFATLTAWAMLVSIARHERQLQWPFIAGLSAGTAAMITSNCGTLAVLAGVIGFLNLRRQWLPLVVYGVGVAVVPVGLLVYASETGVLADAFNDIIEFPLYHYTAVNAVPFGFGASLQNFPLKYLFPFAAVLTVITVTFNWRVCSRDHLLVACAALGLTALAACFPRPDIYHIAYSAPVCLPLVAYCISRLIRRERPNYRNVAACAAAITLCLPPTVVLFLQAREVSAAPTVSTPRGNVAFISEPAAAIMARRIVATPSEDAYFFYPYMSLMAFLTMREDVSRYDLLMAGYSPPIHYQDACISAVQRAAWVVVDRNWTNAGTLKKWFPAIQNVRPRETMAFEGALEDGFELIAQEGTFELRRRKEGIDEKLCTGIVD
jgi:Dolichyl-phosphate-mannose-protein mannosyltransferase